jgi:hypothetical protein
MDFKYMPIKNKNGHICVCVDVRNLNNTCPEDDFPLPITKIMVDTTIGHKRLTFIDGSSNNNHIQWHPQMRRRQPSRLRKEYITIR